jgi:ubiquinone/menaquinone biosynthesis C-methylase UbiE
VTFGVAADAYDRYMGRYSRELAPRLLDFAGVEAGMRALDVGCGPGALVEALAARIGSERVAAADPSEPFVAACAERAPGADVRHAGAEELPWPDASFDVVLAQLVINFLRDAPRGVREMRRVVRPGGVVAACTWEYRGGMRMLRTFWDAATATDPDAPDERSMRYQDPAELRALWEQAGLESVTTAALDVEVGYDGFDDLWDRFTLGVGPGGAYCASLPPERQRVLREECRRRLGDPRGPFRLAARAWAVRGRAAASGAEPYDRAVSDTTRPRSAPVPTNETSTWSSRSTSST